MTDTKPYDTDKYSTVVEGKAEILYPKENKVFYNPVQQFNRDLSTIGIRAWTELYEQQKAAKKRGPNGEVKPFIDIIEALSATGLRAIRYGKEIPKIRTIYANDISSEAVEAIKLNVDHNNVENVVKATQDDANMLMYKHRQQRVHVVDLDPYGSAAPFIDAAVQSVIDGGLLLVTCTDSAILAGNTYPEKCFAHYGGTTVHSDACKEAGIRLILNMVAQAAGKYGKAIEPLLSLSIDFYFRCFIRIKSSPILVKENHSKTMVAYHCSGCNAVTPQPLGKISQRNNSVKYSQAVAPVINGDKCVHCDSIVHIGGPMWAGPLHEEQFMNKILEIRESESKNENTSFGTLPRIEGMVTMAKEELPDVPFYFSLPNTSKIIRSPCPPTVEVASALLNAGYKVSETHAERTCIKTNAPWSFIWEMLRQFSKSNKKDYLKNVKESSPGWRILQKDDPFVSVKFEPHHERALQLEKMRKSKLVRYQMNPQENWGPKARAG